MVVFANPELFADIWGVGNEVDEKMRQKMKENLPEKGEFCLFDFDVVQFNGYSSDRDDSYYDLKFFGGRIHHVSTCACSLIRLKFILDEKDYIGLIRLWNINKSLWRKNPTAIFMNGFGDYVLKLPNGGLEVLGKSLTP